MDPFVKRFYPEFFDLWKAGIFKSSNGRPGVCKSKRRRCPSGSVSNNSLITYANPTSAANSTPSDAKRVCQRVKSSRHQVLIDEQVNELRTRYSELWYSSAQDSTRMRYQIDKRNVSVVEKSARLNGPIGHLETVRKIFTSMSDSQPSCLFKLGLKRFVRVSTTECNQSL